MLLAAAVLVNVVGGAAFILVSILLLYLRPARAGATGFALYALTAGLQHLAGNLGVAFAAEPFGPLVGMLRMPFLLVAPIALVWGAGRLVDRRDGFALAPFVATGILGAMLLLLAPSSIVAPDATAAPLGDFLVTMPYLAGLGVAAWLFATKHARERSPELRQELRLLVLATLPPLAYTAGNLLPFVLQDRLASHQANLGYDVLFLGALALTAWISALLWRSREPGARWLAAFSPALAIAGLAQAILTNEIALLGGIVRLLAALVLGYALLKYRVFDIDVRLKRALAGGLAAGLAVGAFFAVSELTEITISNRTGSTLAGVGAAALLLVVETRVMHVGRRVARRALPRVGDSPHYLQDRKAAIYRAACESAAREGAIDAQHRHILATLARELGVPPEQAALVERESIANAASRGA